MQVGAVPDEVVARASGDQAGVIEGGGRRTVIGVVSPGTVHAVGRGWGPLEKTRTDAIGRDASFVVDELVVLGQRAEAGNPGEREGDGCSAGAVEDSCGGIEDGRFPPVSYTHLRAPRD